MTAAVGFPRYVWFVFREACISIYRLGKQEVEDFQIEM
jgi:hypothetical protein